MSKLSDYNGPILEVENLSISFFTNRNQDIEGVLLMEYPNLCKDLRIIKNVGDIQ